MGMKPEDLDSQRSDWLKDDQFEDDHQVSNFIGDFRRHLLFAEVSDLTRPPLGNTAFMRGLAHLELAAQCLEESHLHRVRAIADRQ